MKFQQPFLPGCMLYKYLCTCSDASQIFIALAAWTKSQCKLKFFRTAWQPHSNALPQYFRLSNKLLPHQACDFWHVVEGWKTEGLATSNFGVRDFLISLWFPRDFPQNDVICCKSGWGWRVGLISELDFKEICFDFSWFQPDFSTRCTRFLSLPTPHEKQSFHLICGASGFYSVVHVERSYLEFFSDADVVFKSAPSRVNVSSL